MNNLAEISSETMNCTGLKSRVERLTERRDDLSGGSRKLAGGSLLRSVLMEIDETILPRRIKIAPHGGRPFDLLVSNRRLIAMSDVEAPDCADPRFVLDRLRAAVGQSRSATITCTRVKPAFSCAETGVSAEALLSSVSTVDRKIADPNPVASFFSELQSQMIAWVTLGRGGGVHKRAGDALWQDRLVTLVGSQLANLEAQRLNSRKSPGQPSCIFLNFGDKHGLTLLYARSDTSGFLALLPAGNLGAIQAAWNARFA